MIRCPAHVLKKQVTLRAVLSEKKGALQSLSWRYKFPFLGRRLVGKVAGCQVARGQLNHWLQLWHALEGEHSSMMELNLHAAQSILCAG